MSSELNINSPITDILKELGVSREFYVIKVSGVLISYRDKMSFYSLSSAKRTFSRILSRIWYLGCFPTLASDLDSKGITNPTKFRKFLEHKGILTYEKLTY